MGGGAYLHQCAVAALASNLKLFFDIALCRYRDVTGHVVFRTRAKIPRATFDVKAATVQRVLQGHDVPVVTITLPNTEPVSVPLQAIWPAYALTAAEKTNCTHCQRKLLHLYSHGDLRL